MLRATYRLGRFFINQRLIGFSSPDRPHMDEASEARFERELGNSRAYLEFGTGGSTVSADRLRKPTRSVDCDPYYVAAVRKALRPDTIVDIITVDIGITREWGKPLFRQRTPARLRRWSRYAEAPFERAWPNGFPDFVLVDGRFRVACALESARQARLAGAATTIMVDDYEDRPAYRAIEAYLGAPERVGRSAMFFVTDDTPMIDAAIVANASTDFQ